MEASIPIFRGGSLINQVRKSKANLLLGKAALQEARDNTALETFQAYIDALYYYGTTRLAKTKNLRKVIHYYTKLADRNSRVKRNGRRCANGGTASK